MKPVSNRVLSIDVFRGLTMAVMIFVNDLASVHGLPWWTYHMPGRIDGMTYVDMVFPAFVFLVGMSLPIAVRARIRRGTSMPQLWLHVLSRTISLVVLGLILANAGKGSKALMSIEPNVWAFTALIGAVLFWAVYPRSERFGVWFRSLRISGLLIMAAMFAIFRRLTPDGHVAWIDDSYWEILGLIGWTYLAVCILYIPTRRWLWAPWAWFVVLLGLNIVTVGHWASWPNRLPSYVWPFGSGALCLLAMGGVIVSDLFLDFPRWLLKRRLSVALGFAVVCTLLAYVLTPLGISKIRATPTWCLYCIASSTALFCLLYWICDMKGRTGWAWPLKPAGSNTLLTYLLPDLYYFGFASATFLSGYEYGAPGVVKALVFTAVMLAISGVLTRLGLRMQL